MNFPSIASRTASSPGLLQELCTEAIERLGAQAGSLTLQRAVLGIFFTGVKLSNGVAGLCATPARGIPDAACCPGSARSMPLPGTVRGRRAVEMLDDLYRTKGLHRALAIATLNALVESLWLRDGPPPDAEVSTGDAFEALRLKPQDKVTLVGAFPPYIRALRKRNQPFNVLELDPASLEPDELPYYEPAERAPQVIPQADVLITTGTTLLNDTLDELLRLLRPGAQAAVIGPTTVLLSGPYARRGVSVIGGTRVLAGDELLELLAEGGSGHHLFGKTVERVTLRMAPGPRGPGT